MPQRRFRLVASADYRPRDNIDVPAVAQLLKQLKSGHKNARNSQKLLFTEMHILERVYYKGNNQHGLSLFWRSVVSVRRMSARIYETNLPGLLEALGSMFHEELFGGQKVFSGAWTRIPSLSSIAQIMERLLDIGMLLQAAISAFRKAYKAFCLAMPNTAFLQLTIVLMSIVSRINAVSSAFLDTISAIAPCVYAVFEAFEPSKPLLKKMSQRLTKFQSSPTTNEPVEPAPSRTSQIPTPIHIDDMDEDLGFSIARSTLPPTTLPASDPMANTPLPPNPPTNSTLSTLLPDVETTTPLLSPPSSPRSLSSQPPPPPPPLPPHAQVLPRNVPVEPPAHAVSTVTTSTKPKKKRKKTIARDEIDDIFG
ncbi:hypothetical protein RSOLAG1IB_00278 [Rhizoctonia solani AG-1 IB]|uniref:Nucleolus and neural progenitor protein-like N-terminal domain-containing protein n=1 Tax=Thanatephorus cucumeris (strain AG1-IB / isolate 7/3/14) TaxID=1108050 RepID=A0A0B7F6B4_THACB|nr:hypothetical protein RSOLAG1IB_00278 [Rhizoctonia solani AG-1 IB]